MHSHSDFIVFADESGDHSLANVNADYPVVVLSFCIFTKVDYVETVCPLLQRFKLRWWPHDAVVLHSLKIRRQERPFVFLKSLDKRERFMADLTDTLSRCPFTLVAGVINKIRLRQQYARPVRFKNFAKARATAAACLDSQANSSTRKPIFWGFR